MTANGRNGSRAPFLRSSTNIRLVLPDHHAETADTAPPVEDPLL